MEIMHCFTRTKQASRTDTNAAVIMSTIENYAEGDAVQIMVSTNGKILRGKNRGLGWRTRQVGGYLSDASLRQLSRDMLHSNSQSTFNDKACSSNDQTLPDDAKEGVFIPDLENTQRSRVFTPASTPSPAGSSLTSIS